MFNFHNRTLICQHWVESNKILSVLVSECLVSSLCWILQRPFVETKKPRKVFLQFYKNQTWFTLTQSGNAAFFDALESMQDKKANWFFFQFPCLRIWIYYIIVHLTSACTVRAKFLYVNKNKGTCGWVISYLSSSYLADKEPQALKLLHRDLRHINEFGTQW